MKTIIVLAVTVPNFILWFFPFLYPMGIELINKRRSKTYSFCKLKLTKNEQLINSVIHQLISSCDIPVG